MAWDEPKPSDVMSYTLHLLPVPSIFTENYNLGPFNVRERAFKMRAYRCISRISWRDRITNIEILNKLKKKVEVIYKLIRPLFIHKTIKRRKLSYLSNKSKLLQLLISGKIAGRQYSWI